MPFEIVRTHPIAEIVLSGVFTNADLAALVRATESVDGTGPEVPHRMTDMRPITRLEIDFGGVLSFANDRLRRRFPNSFKSAVIAFDLAHFGFARMFQTLNDHPQITIAIFGDEVTARAWLESPGLAPPEVAWAPARAERSGIA